ncbi:hypothetical protein C5167_043101 [Papaver somniferum]|uniref:Uncharacterized protein n=1 Tax=Papaver somniferum TaxID=3469 RepID=A0A4Y7L5R1_PAPSO|nr:hypothetical protein C5167_043101 [Papaver somniferum]
MTCNVSTATAPQLKLQLHPTNSWLEFLFQLKTLLKTLVHLFSAQQQHTSPPSIVINFPSESNPHSSEP